MNRSAGGRLGGALGFFNCLANQFVCQSCCESSTAAFEAMPDYTLVPKADAIFSGREPTFCWARTERRGPRYRRPRKRNSGAAGRRRWIWSASASREARGALAGLGRGGRRMESRPSSASCASTLISPRASPQGLRSGQQSAQRDAGVEDLVPGRIIFWSQLARARSQLTKRRSSSGCRAAGAISTIERWRTRNFRGRLAGVAAARSKSKCRAGWIAVPMKEFARRPGCEF